MPAEKEGSTIQYSNQLGREAVYNIWDNQAGHFGRIKDAIKSHAMPVEDALTTANNLTASEDPAQIKSGIHIYRLCMWEEPEVAHEWVLQAPQLFAHPHPRIRHSTIWNLRTAAWQYPAYGHFGLSFAKEGLQDPDPGVQRASMWAHGDFTVNDPELFGDAYASLQSFLDANPKESNYLFALERFFKSLKGPFGEDKRYRSMVSRMIAESTGYPGLRSRSARLLDDEVSSSDVKRDKAVVREKLHNATRNSTIGDLVGADMYDQAFTSTAQDFAHAGTFEEGMEHLKVMKYLAWMSHDIQEPFEILADTLTDKRDGDLARSTSVIMADCAIRQPETLAQPAANAVDSFYGASDIDGSQIVVQLILDPVRHAGDNVKAHVDNVMPSLYSNAANRSVTFALDNN